MGEHPTAQRVEPARRTPEFKAAVLNGGLILFVPAIWTAYVVYTSTAIRPSPPTLLSSAASSLPVMIGFTPVSLVVAWRTYVHARAYRVRTITVWRGPAESAAIGGGSALILMLRATALTWGQQPFYLIIAYIAFYVGATALAGLVLGLILAATALLVLHLQT